MRAVIRKLESSGMYRAHLTSANGTPMWTTRSYERKRDVTRAITALHNAGLDCEVIDET